MDMEETEVYLDRDQCTHLEVEYFEADTLNIPADALLRSKRGGYDSYHCELLEPMGSNIINLLRERADHPGWYRMLGARGRVSER